jgi:hypothetical protein
MLLADVVSLKVELSEKNLPNKTHLLDLYNMMNTIARYTVCISHICRPNLNKINKMIFFMSLLTTFKVSNIYRDQMVISKISISFKTCQSRNFKIYNTHGMCFELFRIKNSLFLAPQVICHLFKRCKKK